MTPGAARSAGAKYPAVRISAGELSGALADLGVLLPLALLMISSNGLPPARVFISFGIAYLVSAAAYHLPIPVQPLKSFAATAIALGLSATVIQAGAWWMALIFWGLAASKLYKQIGRLFPKPLIRGIQIGVGWLLLRSAWNLIAANSLAVELTGRLPEGLSPTLILTTGAAIILLIMLQLRPHWAGLAVIAFGAFAAAMLFSQPSGETLPPPAVGSFGMPSISDFGNALWLLVLPQIPLSLGNAVFAAEDTAARYYGRRAARVSPPRLLTTMGLNSLIAALIGGIPTCHGSGGVTAHYRLGARTAGAPLMLGIGFLALGLLPPGASNALVALFPIPVLAVLLAYVGAEHMRLADDLAGLAEWLPALAVVAAVLLAGNLALGFAAGFGTHALIAAGRRIRKRAPTKAAAV